jgi:hypothetical protein
MPSGTRSVSMTRPLPPLGTCPACSQPAGGERCVHCGVAVRVGPYRVREVLGQRGAARTYLADEPEGLIVLKELSFSSEPDPNTLQAFHQEARQLQSLTHPRVPRYLDMLQLGLGAETRLYLAQEFIEGTPLTAELEGRHYTELEAREVARQVLDILRYLQSRSPQVFHGDLKPANLIRRPDGALFLVDFGAGWVRGRASPEASPYSPPEQNGGELDATTDLFSLGVTLVEALSWEPEAKPHTTRPDELVSRVDVSPDFREFLARLTSVDPALRLGSAHEALRVLEAPALPPAVPLRRRLAPVALGTGAALALFGAGLITGRATSTPLVVDRVPPMASAACPPPEPAPSQLVLSVPPSRRVVTQSPGRPGPELINTENAPPGIKEMLLPGHQPQSCEFAKAGTATASGTWAAARPQAAVDRDVETSWRSSESDGALLQVDLGRNYVLDGLVVVWDWDTRFGDSAQSDIVTSVDGLHWSHLHSITTTPRINDVPHQVQFPQRMARYVRFVGTALHGGWMHVRSFELYGPECPLASAITDPPEATPSKTEY